MRQTGIERNIIVVLRTVETRLLRTRETQIVRAGLGAIDIGVHAFDPQTEFERELPGDRVIDIRVPREIAVSDIVRSSVRSGRNPAGQTGWAARQIAGAHRHRCSNRNRTGRRATGRDLVRVWIRSEFPASRYPRFARRGKTRGAAATRSRSVVAGSRFHSCREVVAVSEPQLNFCRAWKEYCCRSICVTPLTSEETVNGIPTEE